MERLANDTRAIAETSFTYLSSPEFYVQIAIVGVALMVAWAVATFLLTRVATLREPPRPGPMFDMRARLYGARVLVLPLMAVIVLGAAIPISGAVGADAWLVRVAQGVALIVFMFRLVSHFVKNPAIIFALKWIGIPVGLLYVAGLLDAVTTRLDSVAFEVGNIRFSLYMIIRTVLFGVVLFWLGRASNATGQRVIRTQAVLDVGTREVVSKLFEIGIYVLIVILLINIMGLDLTTLTVFSGALGVGLGFGLQQIAANFISGIIILLDRSITIGDYIELEDGRMGTLRELNMRSATLETFDGKDIMVPNERFITTAFVNWTHYNKKQRYSVNFQVAYRTDLEKLFEIVRATVNSHPKVLSGEDLPISERADAEIESFGDSGINILVEFWMEGIDDGDNRVGADLLLMIWTALRANGIEIPFPQREVKILDDAKKA
jgi:small-conductance mechanosensitive channel